MTESTADVLTVTEAARLLRLSRNSTYAAVKRGEIPSRRVGRRLLIPRDALQRFLDGASTCIAKGRDSEPA